MSDELINFIQEKFDERVERNPRYSLRAFAKSIEIEHSALSKILAKKRTLTFETADRILSALKIQTSIKNSLLLSLSNSANYKKERTDDEYITLTEEELSITYRWYFYGFLCSLEIQNLSHTTAGISQFLGLKQELVESIAQSLIRLGAIKKEGHQFSLTGKCYSTTNEVKSSALIDAHREHIQMSLEYLESPSRQSNISDYSGSTVAIPLEKMDEAKRRIKEFRRSLGAWLTADDIPKEDVYRLNIQFFPLAKK